MGRNTAIPPRTTGRGFTLVEVIVVFVLIGILSVVVLMRYSSTTADSVSDLDVIRSVMRQAQIEALSDVSTADWKVVLTGTTLTLQNGTTVSRTYTLRSAITAFSLGFTSYGVPRNQTGTLPFTVNAVTGYTP